ncbi:FAD-dependent oxidoreductase [Cryobacterium luteum]|uniref:FAD-dependent oxidoreductase n=1 Tax=Cryobacterium luteum TaxID=1424661 RepID=A0A1H8L2G7_9MICO|nr:NAD(P)/FAD-dependent oxidoreductase [Cryobacterium luteum]TFB82365.1 FAD-dependent oxidoreductase [Cryobacterium luteum]SEN99289.1 3-phenylpropionate/trans-cinnamate dioxygenase ferredoxin reductase subunit [Cryobacterium luteum]
MTAHHAVILGAGAAGTAAARALAKQDNITITLVGQTDETPYTRMLIKDVAFGRITPDFVGLPMPRADFIADTAEQVDAETREVRLASGRAIMYDSLIVATGSRARRLDANLPGAEQAAQEGTLIALHSLDDAVRIRDAVLACGKPARIAIYGAGLIASETASALQEQGHQVSLIARSTLPGIATFGRSVAARVAADHQSRVTTYFGRTISRIHPEIDATTVTLDDGTDLSADLVIIALGTTPIAPAPWHDSVDVDDRLRAHDFESVYAAGGVTVHHDNHLGTWRIDHWDDGAAQGTHAAQMLLYVLGRGEDPGPYRPRSAHMAMIYGRMIAGVGYTGHPEDTPIESAEEFIVLHEHGGAVVGASGIDAVGAVYQWGQRLHEVYP